MAHRSVTLSRGGKCRFVLLDVAEVDVEVFAVDHYGQLHGSCLAMRELYRQIDKLAPTRSCSHRC